VPGLAQRAVTAFHVSLVRCSRWRLGTRLVGMRVVLLTTTGRRSGARRTVPLTYMEDAGDLILIASNGGAPAHPAWYGNLVANPDVELELDGRRVRARAETVTDPAERARLWERVIEIHSGYAGYQHKTGREIPIVRLSI
jgi:deazaflavin-dependent oxidoreductase (nitroreductase family)